MYRAAGININTAMWKRTWIQRLVFQSHHCMLFTFFNSTPSSRVWGREMSIMACTHPFTPQEAKSAICEIACMNKGSAGALESKWIRFNSTNSSISIAYCYTQVLTKWGEIHGHHLIFARIPAVPASGQPSLWLTCTTNVHGRPGTVDKGHVSVSFCHTERAPLTRKWDWKAVGVSNMN